MILNHIQKQKISFVVRIIRNLEFLLYLAIGLYGFLFLYEIYICQAAADCNFNFIYRQGALWLVRIGYVITSMTNVFLIICNLELFKNKTSCNLFFKSSVVALGVGYWIKAAFLEPLIRQQGLGSSQWIYLLLLLLFFVSTTLVLSDHHSWETSSPFVKIRLIVLIIGFVLFLIAPIPGILLTYLLGAIALLAPYRPGVSKLTI